MIRANNLNILKIWFLYKSNVRESIRVNRPDSRCESPGHLSYAPLAPRLKSWRATSKESVLLLHANCKLVSQTFDDNLTFSQPKLTVRVKIITGSLVILKNLFPKNYRYRYRLEIGMNSFDYHYHYRLGVRSHPFISIDSQLPS